MTTKCPTCGGPVSPGTPAFPFCTPRCRLIDLGRWLGEEYRIPAAPDADEDGEAPPPPRAPLPN